MITNQNQIISIDKPKYFNVELSITALNDELLLQYNEELYKSSIIAQYPDFKGKINRVFPIQWENLFYPKQNGIKGHRGKILIQIQDEVILRQFAGIKTMSIGESNFAITQKEISNESIIWNWEPFNLSSITFHLTAINTTDAQLFDMRKYHGMLYNAIENIDPIFAKHLHLDHRPSLWNFGSFIIDKFDRADDAKIKGSYIIQQNASITWHVSTIYPDIARLLIKINEMNFGRLHIAVHDCKLNDLSSITPTNISAITIKINTPLAMFDSIQKKYLPLTEENLLGWQIAKLKKIGIIKEGDTDILKNYIRFLQIPDRKKGQNFDTDEKKIRIEGYVGYLTIKIMGNTIIREHIYNIFRVSQITGLGSNCNIGFGQNTIKLVK